MSNLILPGMRYNGRQ